MGAQPGRKGRKVGRNARWGGMTQATTSYRQRRNLGVPKGGNGGRWRSGSVKAGRASAPTSMGNHSGPTVSTTSASQRSSGRCREHSLECRS